MFLLTRRTIRKFGSACRISFRYIATLRRRIRGACGRYAFLIFNDDADLQVGDRSSYPPSKRYPNFTRSLKKMRRWTRKVGIVFGRTLYVLTFLSKQLAAAKHAAFVRARGRHYSNEAEAMKVLNSLWLCLRSY